MSLIESIILGAVQGITEFLPISSSGHLVIFQRILGFKEAQLLYDVFFHFGTLLAVTIVYWQDINKLISLNSTYNKERILIITATIPTALIGFFLKDSFEALFASVLAVAVALLITGLLLWLVENISTDLGMKVSSLSYLQAILIGVAQAMAITPGISRSGATIVAGIFLGLSRDSAARFSFLIFIPAVLGATFLEATELFVMGIGEVNLVPLLVGTATSALVGYLAINFLLKILKSNKLNYFAYYVWILGALILVQNLV
ncbi:undecaprenyl-diphosphatase UppP [Fuchsiella alkaliacetigena]|uniref:undecaprenyl-diphosphatase UppP n=1 Tax=Fuchsiella alkaliacetigena TaxID=957042 RepID=UPI00200A984A|nr:undecaprenyl-diphosphatase UppP [Fuchsiella alkaliacetigena]MCK8823474.1 undecaprenyl-diphosphatase UppP [Fuchsiella alkaliacetigena]